MECELKGQTGSTNGCNKNTCLSLYRKQLLFAMASRNGSLALCVALTYSHYPLPLPLHPCYLPVNNLQVLPTRRDRMSSMPLVQCCHDPLPSLDVIACCHGLLPLFVPKASGYLLLSLFNDMPSCHCLLSWPLAVSNVDRSHQPQGPHPVNKWHWLFATYFNSDGEPYTY